MTACIAIISIIWHLDMVCYDVKAAQFFMTVAVAAYIATYTLLANVYTSSLVALS